jgi:hypothetical protein
MQDNNTVVEKSKPQCWEDAALQAVEDLFDFRGKFSNTVSDYKYDNLKNIHKIIDLYIDTKVYLNQESDDESKNQHQSFINMISEFAINLAEDLCEDSLGIEMFKTILVDTLIRKQRDYGPSNISKFAITGIVIRMYDKIGRLTNLSSSKKASSIDETLFDTALDLIGYCAIAHMWINGTFSLPMQKEENN